MHLTENEVDLRRVAVCREVDRRGQSDFARAWIKGCGKSPQRQGRAAKDCRELLGVDVVLPWKKVTNVVITSIIGDHRRTPLHRGIHSPCPHAQLAAAPLDRYRKHTEVGD